MFLIEFCENGLCLIRVSSDKLSLSENFPRASDGISKISHHIRWCHTMKLINQRCVPYEKYLEFSFFVQTWFHSIRTVRIFWTSKFVEKIIKAFSYNGNVHSIYFSSRFSYLYRISQSNNEIFRLPCVRSKFFWGEGVVDGEGGSSERCLKWGGGGGGH